MGDLLDTLEAVFPYPYRFWRAVFSRTYRRAVGALYRTQPKSWVLVDVLLSGFFFLAETVLILGIPIALIFG